MPSGDNQNVKKRGKKLSEYIMMIKRDKNKSCYHHQADFKQLNKSGIHFA
jgi:hypothetical protein